MSNDTRPSYCPSCERPAFSYTHPAVCWHFVIVRRHGKLWRCSVCVPIPLEDGQKEGPDATSADRQLKVF